MTCAVWPCVFAFPKWEEFNGKKVKSKMDALLNYCQSCLSSDRKLFPLNELQGLLQHISLWEFLSARGGLCWECHGTVTKFANFKTRLLKAQELLHNATKVQDLETLSFLTTQNNLSNEYYYNYNEFSNQEITKTIEERNANEAKEYEFQIKHEEEEQTYSSEEKSSDEEEKSQEENEIQTEVKLGNIYVDSLRENKKVKKKKIKKLEKESEEEVREKFTTVEFTEEEMLRNREEKRSQPNFKKIPYKCDLCVLGFTKKVTYDAHMKKKHNENVGDHICPVCQVHFTSSKQVERHKTKHYVCYRCKLCKYETLELWSALSHCRSKHIDDRLESIHCGCCKFVAKTPEELTQHTTIEHRVYCNECGEKFKALSTLKTHIRRIHTIKREFVCDICSKTFKTKSRLESHMAGHNAIIAQKLSYCAPCRIQYKNIYVYRNHLRTSANHADQAYQCLDCNKRFASKVYWKKHYNFYHLHKSQFRCDLCNKLFISDWRLKNHRQTQHGLNRSRDHHCNVCGKQFFTLSTLKGHQLTHSEHRSFMCEDCGDTFKQRPALYTHYKLVHRGMKRRRKLT